MNDTIAISLASGFLGALAGCFGTIYASNRQIRASTVSANRQQWINALRDEVASFLTHLDMLGYLTKGNFLPGSTVAETFKGIHLSEAKIQLMINPKVADHKKLVALLQDAIGEAVRQNRTNEESAEPKKDVNKKVVEQTQHILKREWGLDGTDRRATIHLN